MDKKYKHDAIGTLEFCNELLNKIINDKDYNVFDVLIRQTGTEYTITIQSYING